jgi:hypothetical protein
MDSMVGRIVAMRPLCAPLIVGASGRRHVIRIAIARRCD